MTALYRWLGSTGLFGIALDGVCAGLLTVLVLAAVPLLGFVIERIRHFVYAFLRKAFGGVAGYMIMNYLTFPGVILHEFCHVLVAKLTGAKVLEAVYFGPDGKSLGHVTVSYRGKRGAKSFQAAATSCAPVFLGFLLSWLLGAAIRWMAEFPVCVAYLWHIRASLWCHMAMSRADLKAYGKGCPGMLFRIFPVCFIAVYFWARMSGAAG